VQPNITNREAQPAIYAPQLRILDEDLLARFPARERAEAERLRTALRPLLPLR
jgi:hypothetical protein